MMLENSSIIDYARMLLFAFVFIVDLSGRKQFFSFYFN